MVAHPRPARPRATIHADGSCTIELGTPYPLVISLLKGRVPTEARRYDPVRRSWQIDSSFALTAIRSLRYALPDAQIVTVRGNA